MSVAEMWCRVTVFRPDGSPLGSWTLRGVRPPDLDAVDRIAHLHLAAKALGGATALTDVTPALRELLELAGLGELFGQPGGEAESREDAVDVQERVIPGDSSR
jgi:hypothetical protein